MIDQDLPMAGGNLLGFGPEYIGNFAGRLQIFVDVMQQKRRSPKNRSPLDLSVCRSFKEYRYTIL
jgi:hypothetical protein